MYKTLLSHVGAFKKAAIITPIFMVGEVAAEMLIPKMMGSIIDNGIEKANMNHILFMGGLMVLMAVVGFLTGAGGAIYGSKAATGFARNLRKAMYDNIQTFSFSNIDKFSTAGLITRMTTDVTNLQNAFMMVLRMCFRAPFSIIIAMILAFSISPSLASVYLIAVLVLIVVLGLIMFFAMRYFNQVFKKYDELNASVKENISAIRVVKAYVREEHEKERFGKANANLYKMFVRAEKIVALNAPVMNLATYSCILLISWFGAKMAVVGDLSTGDLSALLAYCMNILMSLMMLSMVFVMLILSVASGKRICEVLEEQADIVNPENPVMEVTDGSVRFDHVDFAYHKDGSGENVLKDICLDIAAGETVGIIGGTGSAKSSLVNLISRLYDVNGDGTQGTGAVYVGGVDVRQYDLEVLRDKVAVVLQKNVLFSGTILENLRWGKEDATEEECIHACQLACADEFIQQMPDKYETYIEQGGSNVSGGQKQRLCIARALLKNPKVLILDDSTSAVDTATDAKIRAAFAQGIPGTTTLIIAQRISSVQNADHIIVMDNGCVSGFGTHEELLATNEIYRDVYETQTQGGGDFDEKGGDR